MNIDPETYSALKIIDSVRLCKFCDITGMRKTEVQSKIRRKEWTEGREYTKDPDGRIHIILTGYRAWVLKNKKAIESEMEKSRSALKKKAQSNAHIKPSIQPSTQIPQVV